MKIKSGSVTILTGFIFMNSCVAYAPPIPLAPFPTVAPYGSYYYGVSPVMPIPIFGGGWGYGRYRHH